MVATARVAGGKSGVPAKSVQELIQLARAKPAAQLRLRRRRHASRIRRRAVQDDGRVNMVHIPTREHSRPQRPAAGQVQVVFSDMPIALRTPIRQGPRACVTSAKRTPLLPPCDGRESGVPVTRSKTHGRFRAAARARHIVAKLNAEVVRVHGLRMSGNAMRDSGSRPSAAHRAVLPNSSNPMRPNSIK